MSDVKVRLGADYDPRGMQQFIVDTREGETAAEALTRAMGQENVVAEESEVAHSRASTGMGGMGSSARALRLGIAGLTADMALATIASGEQLPAGLREAAKGLQSVTDLAVAGAFAFGPVGAIIGATAGGFLALASAANTLTPAEQDLNKELDKLAAKDDTIKTLETVLGLTEADATAAFNATKGSAEYAQSLANLASVQERIKSAQDTLNNPFLDSRTRQATENALNFLAGEQAYNAYAERTNRTLADRNQILADNQKQADGYYKEVINLSDQEASNEASNAAQMLTYAKQEQDAFVAAQQARLTAEQNAISQSERIERSYEDALAQAEQSLADKRNTIDREYHDKESDLAYNEEKQKEQDAQADIDRQKQLSEKLAEIQLTEAQSLEQLDFNTNEALRGAKTQREAEDIRRKALFERGQIQQHADDEKAAARQQAADEKQLADERRQMQDQDFAHQHDINVRETNEKVADAQLAAKEQVAAALKRNTEENADLVKSLAAQEAAITLRYTDEVKKIEDAKTAFIAAESAKQAALAKTIAAIVQEITLLTKAVPNLSGGGAIGVTSGGDTQGYTPAPVIPDVAPTTAAGGGGGGGKRQGTMLGGETPIRNSRHGSDSQGSTPQMVFVSVEPMVRPVVESMLAQFANGHVFKQGVKVILNDAM